MSIRLRCTVACLLQGSVWVMARADPASASAPLRIFVAGDSTASSYGADRWPRTGWGQVLAQWFGPEVAVHNHAVSGRSTLSYRDLGHEATLLAALGTGDVLLIQFGHNDQKQDDPARYTDPQQAFPAGLRRLLEQARARGARPVLITPVARRQFDAAGVAQDTHGAYAEAVRAVAVDTRTPLIDLGQRSLDALNQLGPEASKAYYLHDPVSGLADDTHFHVRGALLMACLVVDGLRQHGLLENITLQRDADCGVPADQSARRAAQVRPSVIQHAGALERAQPGPHGGHGPTIAAPFFADQPDLDLIFRQRTLRAGGSIGLHAHGKDEIYYVVSGRGELTLDGKASVLTPGHAVLTRDGSTHSLRQIGSEDLVILIVYRKPPAP